MSDQPTADSNQRSYEGAAFVPGGTRISGTLTITPAAITLDAPDRSVSLPLQGVTIREGGEKNRERSDGAAMRSPPDARGLRSVGRERRTFENLPVGAVDRGFGNRGMLEEDQSIGRAIVFGSVLASFNVESFSLNRLREISRDDIMRRYREFHKLTQFEELDA